ncbi:MAG: RluA family pseudouridine synthase [Alphaproteobacteria bacterium]|nr:RluA family pseudouridine synthase [Alphaproteobacteria bacterium]MBE8219957.1 RluA family pseudouridine synthase [Alphaproteobacteria bacterium]
MISDKPFQLTATPDNDGYRLDKLLAQALPELSRVRVQDLIRDGHCEVSRAGRVSIIKESSWRVKRQDHIRLQMPPPRDSHIEAQSLPLDIIYEDEALIVLNKPAGLVVHPAAGNPDHTLVNALLAHCGDALSGIGGERRPGIVHRLDKDTSGVMVAAKTDAAHQGLQDQFAAHGRDGKLQRIYHAFVWGQLRPPTGVVDAPLARAPNNRRKISVSKPENKAARSALTHYKQMGVYRGGRVSRLACTLETGRTHQIRVHLAHIGHPLLGDPLYGSGMKNQIVHLTPPQAGALQDLSRQALHAFALGFEHPISGETLYFENPLPSDMAHLATLLETEK